MSFSKIISWSEGAGSKGMFILCPHIYKVVKKFAEQGVLIREVGVLAYTV